MSLIEFRINLVEPLIKIPSSLSPDPCLHIFGELLWEFKICIKERIIEGQVAVVEKMVINSGTSFCGRGRGTVPRANGHVFFSMRWRSLVSESESCTLN